MAAFEKTSAKIEASLVKTFVKLEKSPDCRTTQDVLLIHGLVRTVASTLATFRNEAGALVFNGFVLTEYPGTPSFSGNSGQSMEIRFVDGPLVTMTSSDQEVVLTTSDSHSLVISDEQFHFDGSLVDLDAALAAMERAFETPPAQWSAFHQVLMSYGALTRLYVASDLLLLGKGAPSAAVPSTPQSSRGVTRAMTPISLRRNCNLNHDAACSAAANMHAIGVWAWEKLKCQLPKPNKLGGPDCATIFATCEAGVIIISEGALIPVSPLICSASVKLCNDLTPDPSDPDPPCEATQIAKDSVPGYKQMCLEDSVCPSGWSCEKSATLYSGDPWRFRCNPAHCPDGFTSCVQGGVCCNNTFQNCDPDLEICVDKTTTTTLPPPICEPGTYRCGSTCCGQLVGFGSTACDFGAEPPICSESGCCLGGTSVTQTECARSGGVWHHLGELTNDISVCCGQVLLPRVPGDVGVCCGGRLYFSGDHLLCEGPQTPLS